MLVDKHLASVPGPGTYESPSKNPRYKASPMYGFGSAKRKEMADKTERPGPGNYESRTSVGEAAKYSIGIKNAADSAIPVGSLAPGPGAYTPNHVAHVSSAYSIKGKYKVGTQIAITPEGGHEKMTASADFNAPGPGTYTSRTEQVYKNYGSNKFGQELRPSLNAGLATKNPAPNAYSRDAKSAVLRGAPNFGFGTSKRPQTTKSAVKVPGPGAYVSKPLFGGKDQGKSLGKRLEQARASYVSAPGAGAYNPNAHSTLQAAPGWRIGTSTRDQELAVKRRVCNFPSSDAYNPNYLTTKDSAARFSFGTGGRSKLAQSKTVPGPGAYQIGSRAVEGPANSMGLKMDNQSAIGIELKKTRGNPGAGTYNGDFNVIRKNNGAFSLKGRYTISEKKLVPGPGAYAEVKSTGKAAPSFGFGTASQRQKQAPPTAPGPGNYHIPGSIGNTGRAKGQSYV